MKYRKKSIEIEAYKLEPDKNSFPEWIIEDPRIRLVEDDDGNLTNLYIDTLEGTMRACVGDYIIKGIHGELYPCKPDIFKETYEKVDD